MTAGLYGLTGVALGAFGAHALRARLLESGMDHAWETGVHYHLLHSVALLALAGSLSSEVISDQARGWIGRFWAIGIFLFSGSLYLIALGGPRWLGPITPLGGLSFLAGWVGVIVSGLKAKN